MTNVHEWYVSQREAFVVRHLEADEERLFREHLPGCDECRAEVQALERELAWLALGAAPLPPRPGLVRSLTDRVLSPPQPAIRWRQWAPMALAASAVLAMGLGWWRARERAENYQSDLALATRELAAVQDTLSILRQTTKVMHASLEMDGQRGGLIILADSVSHRWNVVVHGLPPAPAGQRYQFWFILDDGMVRGAEVAPRAGGAVVLTLGMPSNGGRVMGASLSIEPMNMPEDSPPQGKELAHLMLES